LKSQKKNDPCVKFGGVCYDGRLPTPSRRLGPERARRMAFDGDHLDLARRHFAEGKMRVERQAELVEHLRRCGHSTDLAENLLQAFVDTLRQMKIHRDYLEQEARSI
jgi:hypothetical protein